MNWKALTLLIPLGLGGCQTFNALTSVLALNAPNPVTPKAIYEARLAYDAAEVVAIHYIRLPLCPRSVACSDPKVSAQLKAAGPIARAALNKADAFVRAHPTITSQALIVEGTDLYQQYTAAVAAFQAIEAANQIK